MAKIRRIGRLNAAQRRIWRVGRRRSPRPCKIRCNCRAFKVPPASVAASRARVRPRHAIPVARLRALSRASPCPRARRTRRALRDQIDAARAKEQRLSADVGRLDALAAKVQGQLATLERRRAEVQADLDRDQARLDRARRPTCEAERTRLARLQAAARAGAHDARRAARHALQGPRRRRRLRRPQRDELRQPARARRLPEAHPAERRGDPRHRPRRARPTPRARRERLAAAEARSARSSRR